MNLSGDLQIRGSSWHIFVFCNPMVINVVGMQMYQKASMKFYPLSSEGQPLGLDQA